MTRTYQYTPDGSKVTGFSDTDSGGVTRSATSFLGPVTMESIQGFNPQPVGSNQNGNNQPPAPTATPASAAIPTPAPATTPTTAPPPPSTGSPYTGTSIVDALKAGGQPSDYASRAKLAGEQGIQNYTGTADQNTQLLQKYKQGFASATASGQPAPQTTGGGSAGVQAHIPATTPQQPSIVGSLMETDSNFDSIFTGLDKLFSPEGQQKSLVDEYKSMSDSLGITGLNTELINAKKVIDGTEDDIRSEITSAGGFATESQVQALANARNKSLIKNYNTLLATRDNATQQLDTMMNLSKEDRAAAQQELDSKMNFAFKIADFQQKAIDNSRTQNNKLLEAFGADGIQKMLGGNAYETSLFEKSLGMPTGGLAQAATIAAKDRATKNMSDALDVKYKQAQVANLQSEINARKPGSSSGVPINPDIGNYSTIDISRYSRAANSIIKNFIALPQYNLTANGLPFLQRIQAADSVPGSVSDAELLDSIVKLNTGGGQVTEAQVKLITGGKSFSDALSVWKNKLGNGGVLSDSQRKQLTDLGSKVFDKYKAGYQPVYDQATKQLEAAGIPKAFWTIPDLNNLSKQEQPSTDNASTAITNSGTTVNGLTATGSWGTLTFPDQKSLDAFKKDHNI